MTINHIECTFICKKIGRLLEEMQRCMEELAALACHDEDTEENEK